MAKRNRQKRRTMIKNTLHRKLKIEQHDPTKKKQQQKSKKKNKNENKRTKEKTRM
jgi:hypothetical protein